MYNIFEGKMKRWPTLIYNEYLSGIQDLNFRSV